MKFVYEYRSSDNVRHEGIISAVDRESAFQELKACGIRPGNLSESPGLFNHFVGHYKRWTAIVVLVIAATYLLVDALVSRNQIEAVERRAVSPLMRRQVYGDPALMEELSHSEYRDVFPVQADRYLACYAQPATSHRFEGMMRNQRARIAVIGKALAELSANHFAPPIAIANTDSREVAELKRIVMWMRGELKEYLSNGIGTPESYARRLEQRQVEECGIYGRIKMELSRTKDEAEWENGNNRLRAIGAPTIPLPE